MGAYDATSVPCGVERGGSVRPVDAAAGDEQHQQPAPVQGVVPAGGHGGAEVAVVERARLVQQARPEWGDIGRIDLEPEVHLAVPVMSQPCPRLSGLLRVRPGRQQHYAARCRSGCRRIRRGIAIDTNDTDLQVTC